MWLWIRIGDIDNYHDHDCLSDIAEQLVEFGIERVEWHDIYGVSATGFDGHNYISLFWGDRQAQPIRGLTKLELYDLNILIERELRYVSRQHR